MRELPFYVSGGLLLLLTAYLFDYRLCLLVCGVGLMSVGGVIDFLTRGK